jgi:hypothetical protein
MRGEYILIQIGIITSGNNACACRTHDHHHPALRRTTYNDPR